MSELTHTPAPWFAVKSAADFWNICIENYIYSPGIGGGCMSWNEQDANLIAAAPEMLAEMESLAQTLEDTHDIPQSFYDVIAKARGRI